MPDDDVATEDTKRSLSRRTLIKGTAAGTAVAWAVPVVHSAPAWASPGSGAPGCPPGGHDTGRNLVVDGGFESDTAVTSDTANAPDSGAWTATGNVSVQAYAGGEDSPVTSDPNKGSNYLYGGPANDQSSVQQTIGSLDADTIKRIDAGCAKYVLSGYLGGYDGQDDTANLSVVFKDTGGATLATDAIAGPDSTQRGGVTSLLYESTNGTVPAGTRSIEIQVTLVKAAGSDNDGLADSISLIFS